MKALVINCRSLSHGAAWAAIAAALCLSAIPARADMFPVADAANDAATFNTYTFAAKNWGGYVAQYPTVTGGSTAQTNEATYVSGTWTVPSIGASLSPTFSNSTDFMGTWVGLDGFITDSSHVEQCGTACQFSGGHATYYAWYEFVGSSSPAPVTEFSVNPGDTITASVQYNAPGFANQYLCLLTDVTTNQSFSIAGTDAGTRSSAEWIVEAPSGSVPHGDGVYPLPQFGSDTFTNATATLGGVSGAIDDPAFATWYVPLEHFKYGDFVTPGSLLDTGSGPSATSSFTVVQTPEPSTVAILASLALGGAVLKLRRSRQRRE